MLPSTQTTFRLTGKPAFALTKFIVMEQVTRSALVAHSSIEKWKPTALSATSKVWLVERLSFFKGPEHEDGYNDIPSNDPVMSEKQTWGRPKRQKH